MSKLETFLNRLKEFHMLVDMLAEIINPMVEKLDSLEKLVMSSKNNSQYYNFNFFLFYFCFNKLSRCEADNLFL